MYASAKGAWAVKSAGADVVARLNPHTLRVCNRRRQVISLLSLESRVPKVGVMEVNVIIPIPPAKKTKSHKTWCLAQSIAWLPARALAARSRKGEVIWVLTTLPGGKAKSVHVMALYRLRWQVELFFKRLKSLLGFDSLPSRQGPTAKSWMLCRLLAAALAQRLVRPNRALSPWGYEIQNIGPADQCVVALQDDAVGDAPGSPR